MILFPNAKINLGLNITEKRSDGYHNLETVFYPIPLEDVLEVVPAKDSKVDCRLTCSGIPVEGDPEKNLVVKAYRLLQKKYELPPIEIYLRKQIPSGAGMGGGSSDAAFMLKLLNDRFHLQMTTVEMETYASTLGADCAFFVRNEPVFAEGIGNIFSPIHLSLKGYTLVVVKPDIFVSTKEAFALVIPRKPKISIQELIQAPVSEWKETLKNDFEESVFRQFPAIEEIKQQLYEAGAVYASMSGSGSSVYGLFKETPEETLKEQFAGSFYQPMKL
jgi:4-diphosphocytidyl-2-C-methyl-D-erythritol kinase